MVPTPPSICSSSAGSIAGMVHGSVLVRVLSLGVMVWSLPSWPSVRCLPERRAADSAGRFVTLPHQDTVRGVARGRFPCRGGRQRRHAMRCRLLGDFNFEEAPAREAAGADGGRGQVTAFDLLQFDGVRHPLDWLPAGEEEFACEPPGAGVACYRSTPSCSAGPENKPIMRTPLALLKFVARAAFNAVGFARTGSAEPRG